MRVSNPASNDPLLTELAKRFTESNYDFKALVRDICRSEAYQRSTEKNTSNETDERNFASQTLRRIKAESMLDIISQVTTTKDKFPRLPLGARASKDSEGRFCHDRTYATMADASSYPRGPPRATAHALIVVPGRPLTIASRRKSSEAMASRSSFASAGA